MFNTNVRKHVTTGFCFFALLFAAAVGVVDAQTDSPIDEDDIIVSVPVGDDFWISPLALKIELEMATGGIATIETMADLLGRLPTATPSNGVRFEGGMPALAVQQDLGMLGYQTQSFIPVPAVQGALFAIRQSL